MKYEKIVEGKFIERPNRFVALVDIEGKEQKVHVKNTGRCKELLTYGTKVFMEDFRNRMGKRKLEFSLIGVEKLLPYGNSMLINMDSQVPNKVVEEGLKSGAIKIDSMGRITCIKREKSFGKSRVDFYLEDENGQKGYFEVKGVTLEHDGRALFPDAPTLRGVKHIRELISIKKLGMAAGLIFVVQMEDILDVRANTETHPEFGAALSEAIDSGVEVRAFCCHIEKDSICITKEIPVI